MRGTNLPPFSLHYLPSIMLCWKYQKRMMTMILWTKRRNGGIFCIGVELHGRPCFWQCTHCNNTHCCIFLILIGQFRKSSSFFRGERRRQPPPLARSSDRSSLSACELQEKLFELNYTIDRSITHLLHSLFLLQRSIAPYTVGFQDGDRCVQMYRCMLLC